MPKVSFFSALSVGMESRKEAMDIELVTKTAPSEVKDRMSCELPEGIEVIRVDPIPPGEKRPRIREAVYRIIRENGPFDEVKSKAFNRSERFVIVKITKKGKHEIDARPLVKSMSVEGSLLHMRVKHDPSGLGPGLKPKEIVKGVFDLGDDELLGVHVLKTDQVLA
ncbi:MAG: TIGR03936 family radical SAM-associated protein [Deltaproteobacteria bacterium]|nr:TIGR03936 family radical SAM-associated protein [Deltaproteobacteria bacterium]